MLTQEQKETMIAALRGKSVAKENITEEYKKILKDKKLGNLNQLPQNETLKKVVETAIKNNNTPYTVVNQ